MFSSTPVKADEMEEVITFVESPAEQPRLSDPCEMIGGDASLENSIAMVLQRIEAIMASKGYTKEIFRVL